MRSCLLLFLLLIVSINSHAFVGRYEIELPFAAVSVSADEKGNVEKLKNDMVSEDDYLIMATLADERLDMIISGQNDGSPKLSRIVFVKSSEGSPRIEESYTVINDGDPILATDVVSLSFFQAPSEK